MSSTPSWQDQFRKERTRKNDLVHQVKDLNSELLQLRKQAMATATGSYSHGGYTREESDFISELKSRNQEFLCENKRLKGRLKCAFFTVQRFKEQVQSLKRRLKGFSPPSGCGGSTKGCTNVVCNKLGDISSNTEELLQSALENNQILQEELNRLKELSRTVVENTNNGGTHSLPEENQSAQEVARVLRIEYDTLESTSQVQLQVHKKTREKLEQCNDYIRKLESERYELESMNNITRTESVSIDQYQEHMDELLKENRQLEDKLANLCDLPFLQEEPVKNQFHLEELKDLENELDRCKQQINAQSKANICLEDNLETLEEENDALRSASDDLRQQMSCRDDQIPIR